MINVYSNIVNEYTCNKQFSQISPPPQKKKFL